MIDLRSPYELVAELQVEQHSDAVALRMDGAWRLIRRLRKRGLALLANDAAEQAVWIAREIAAEIDAGDRHATTDRREG